MKSLRRNNQQQKEITDQITGTFTQQFALNDEDDLLNNIFDQNHQNSVLYDEYVESRSQELPQQQVEVSNTGDGVLDVLKRIFTKNEDPYLKSVFEKAHQESPNLFTAILTLLHLKGKGKEAAALRRSIFGSKGEIFRFCYNLMISNKSISIQSDWEE